MKNIALIGFMGSGKSTVAIHLSEKLGFNLREIDNDIINLSHYSTINEIFDYHGEEHFRKLERQAIISAAQGKKQIISCGGGVVASPDAMELLKKSAIVVFLHADIKTILERLNNNESRPLFRDMEKALVLYAQRLPLYRKYSDLEINTDNISPEQITEIIWKKYCAPTLGDSGNNMDAP